MINQSYPAKEMFLNINLEDKAGTITFPHIVITVYNIYKYIFLIIKNLLFSMLKVLSNTFLIRTLSSEISIGTVKHGVRKSPILEEKLLKSCYQTTLLSSQYPRNSFLQKL